MERTIITDPAKLAEHHPAAVRLVVHGDFECWTRHLVLDRAKCCEIYRSLVAARGRFSAWSEAFHPGWFARYRGPGQSFQRQPWKRKSKRFVVISQQGGLDI